MDEPMRLFNDADLVRIAPAPGPVQRSDGSGIRAGDASKRLSSRPDGGRVVTPPSTATARLAEPDGRLCPQTPVSNRHGAPTQERLDLKPSVVPSDDPPSDNLRQPANDAILGPRLVTIDCAARLLGVGRTTLYEQIATGHLQVVHIGRAARVPVTSIDAFVAELTRRTTVATSATEYRPPSAVGTP